MGPLAPMGTFNTKNGVKDAWQRPHCVFVMPVNDPGISRRSTIRVQVAVTRSADYEKKPNFRFKNYKCWFKSDSMPHTNIGT